MLKSRKYMFHVFVVVLSMGILYFSFIKFSYSDIVGATNIDYLLLNSTGIGEMLTRQNTSVTSSMDFKNSVYIRGFTKTPGSNTTMEAKYPNISESINAGGEAEIYRNYYVNCPDPIGRLGNQMFQLAAAIGLAHSLNFVPIIKASHPLVEQFELSNVKHDSNVHLNNVKEVNENWLHTKKEQYLQHNLTVSGYFQSWKYFQNASGAVRKAFTIKPKYNDAAKSFLSSNINGSKTIIGLHIRRGDYLLPAKQAIGRVVADGNYTTKAMNFFRQRYKDAYFIVCSDDKKWCKDNINGTDVLFSKFEEPIMDMAIMSLCDHMITSGGTFSWWGGWLSGGTVVYLSDFPRPGSRLVHSFKETYYPPYWIGLSN